MVCKTCIPANRQTQAPLNPSVLACRRGRRSIFLKWFSQYPKWTTSTVSLYIFVSETLAGPLRSPLFSNATPCWRQTAMHPLAMATPARIENPSSVHSDVFVYINDRIGVLAMCQIGLKDPPLVSHCSSGKHLQLARRFWTNQSLLARL